MVISGIVRAAGAGFVAAAIVAACKYDWPLDDEQTPILRDGSAGNAADAAADADSGATLFSCSGRPSLFCDSFDDGQIEGHWDRSYIGSGATVRVDPFDSAPTAPNVLLTTVPAQSSSPSNYAYVARNLKTAATPELHNATLSFAIRPETLDPASRGCVAGIVFGDGTGTERTARILLGKEDGILQEIIGGTSRTYTLSAVPPAGAWSRMSLSVAVSGRLVVRIGETTVLDASADPAWQPSNAIRFVAGINFYDKTPTTGMSFRFDDVLLEGS
jgi:hypothetical protein